MTDFVTGDTGSKLRVSCKDTEGNVINLTSCTVRLRWEGADGAIVTKTMDHVDDALGIAEYQFASTDLIAPKMKFEVEITDQSTMVVSNLDLIEVVVREQLG